jgi:hypothetical protein
MEGTGCGPDCGFMEGQPCGATGGGGGGSVYTQCEVKSSVTCGCGA